MWSWLLSGSAVLYLSSESSTVDNQEPITTTAPSSTATTPQDEENESGYGDFKVWILIFIVSKLLNMVLENLRKKLTKFITTKVLTALTRFYARHPTFCITLACVLLSILLAFASWVVYVEYDRIWEHIHKTFPQLSPNTTSTTTSIPAPIDLVTNFRSSEVSPQSIPIPSLPIVPEHHHLSTQQQGSFANHARNYFVSDGDDDFNNLQTNMRTTAIKLTLLFLFHGAVLHWVNLDWCFSRKLAFAIVATAVNVPLLHHSGAMYLASGKIALGVVLFATVRHCCQRRKKNKANRNETSNSDTDMTTKDKSNKKQEKQRQKEIKRLEKAQKVLEKKQKQNESQDQNRAQNQKTTSSEIKRISSDQLQVIKRKDSGRIQTQQ